ncbi:glycerate kinase [Vagococcus vulneris]|uniref:Glycerate kinase n=1 Tax=Vagococcus vulneris TaxID=1977869 RepID=A0A429ZXK5_9ENTE|nr:glycerate kinase [Vagococcus vulneris]RST98619.1 hypothetical protein CBF37_07535 [Vagococcus vulneris]
MLKFLLAPDSFKDSMTAKEACSAMEKGLKTVYGNRVWINQIPMADGGEGTVQTLVDATHGNIQKVIVSDLFRHKKIEASYGIINQSEKTAIIEMAQASGLELLKFEERNPLLTSTYGTGELIKDALNRGIRKFIVTLGGSATNDGGAGMAEALGVKFYDKSKNIIQMNGGNLYDIASIDVKSIDARVYDCEFEAACDVTNPLLGPKGTTKIFSQQKGANTESVRDRLESGLMNYGNIVEETMGCSYREVPGSGAAGGLGFGIQVFLNGKLISGINLVSNMLDLEEAISQADIIFTGEGSIDGQSSNGKVISGIAELCKVYEKPLIACGGVIKDDANVLYEQGVTAMFSIVPSLSVLDDCLKQGSINLEKTCENIARVMEIKKQPD